MSSEKEDEAAYLRALKSIFFFTTVAHPIELHSDTAIEFQMESRQCG